MKQFVINGDFIMDDDMADKIRNILHISETENGNSVFEKDYNGDL